MTTQCIKKENDLYETFLGYFDIGEYMEYSYGPTALGRSRGVPSRTVSGRHGENHTR